jgi:hypothetical protein
MFCTCREASDATYVSFNRLGKARYAENFYVRLFTLTLIKE